MVIVNASRCVTWLNHSKILSFLFGYVEKFELLLFDTDDILLFKFCVKPLLKFYLTVINQFLVEMNTIIFEGDFRLRSLRAIVCFDRNRTVVFY